MTYRIVRFPSGREVGVTGMGDPASAHLALFLHPTPGASGFDPDPSVSARSGLHILSFDRPGYGATEPDSTRPDSTGPDEWVDDLAGHLRSAEGTALAVNGTAYGRIGVIGWREGGIFAAALAARHPQLISRLALIGVPTPMRAGAAAQQGRPEHGAGVGVDIVRSAETMDHPGYESRVDRMRDSAAVQGGSGVDADRLAFRDHSEQQFRVDAPVTIVYGAMDDYATGPDAEWYSAGMPDSRIERVDGTVDPIANRWEDVLRFIREG